VDLDDAELTRRCEQAIRNYDPCISWSAHFLDLTVKRPAIPRTWATLVPAIRVVGSWPVRAGSAELKAEVSLMDDFFKILAAGPAFFVSAWLLMLFAGVTGSDTGIRPFGYITAIVVTIGLWLTLAPAIGAIARTSKSKIDGPFGRHDIETVRGMGYRLRPAGSG
jgi:hypothetical protein